MKKKSAKCSIRCKASLLSVNFAESSRRSQWFIVGRKFGSLCSHKICSDKFNQQQPGTPLGVGRKVVHLCLHRIGCDDWIKHLMFTRSAGVRVCVRAIHINANLIHRASSTVPHPPCLIHRLRRSPFPKTGKAK